MEPEAPMGAVQVVIVDEFHEHSVEVPLVDDDRQRMQRFSCG